MKSKRIFIAGDDPLFRVSLKIELEQIGNFQVVGEARNATAAVSGICSSVPDLSIIDSALPGPSAEKNIVRLRQVIPGMKIVMLATFGDDDIIKCFMAAGADGYIMKNTENYEIIKKINYFLDKNKTSQSE